MTTKTTLSTACLFAACALFAAGQADAATVASYVDGGNNSAADGAGAAGLTASAITSTSLGGDINSDNTPNAEFWFDVNGNNAQSNNTYAKYWGFTLTADAGNVLNLNTISFDIATVAKDAVVDGDGGSLSASYRVQYSTDGGLTFTELQTANLETLVVPAGSSLPLFSSIQNIVVDASSVTGVSEVLIAISPDISEAATERSGGWVTAPLTGNNNRGGRNNQAEILTQNIVVDGSVAPVPEPGSLALLGLGGLLIAKRRRRG